MAFLEISETLEPSLYARIRTPSYFSSNTQLGLAKGASTRVASIGETLKGMVFVILFFLQRSPGALLNIRLIRPALPKMMYSDGGDLVYREGIFADEVWAA
jgi:hypothetical protein